MYDIIASLSVGLLIMCLANLYFSIGVQLTRDFDENDPRERQIHLFVVGVTCFCVFSLFQSLSYLLWDFDLITKSSQYKISIISRFFGIAASFLFFLTLSLGITRKTKTLILWGAIAGTILMYLGKVLF